MVGLAQATLASEAITMTSGENDNPKRKWQTSPKHMVVMREKEYIKRKLRRYLRAF